MNTTTSVVSTITVGDRVEYHGSQIAAHGVGNVIAVYPGGRIDVQVTCLNAPYVQVGQDLRYISTLTVRQVRRASVTPLHAGP